MQLNTNNHLLFTSKQEIDQISKPLKDHFGITSVIYQKNFNDGSEIRLVNQPLWQEHFFQHELYKISGFEKHPSLYQSGFVVWSHMTHHQPILAAARQFNIDHGITMINKTHDGVEFYFLGTTPDKPHLTNFFLNNIDLIQRFILYFKEQAAPLITRANTQRIVLPNKYQVVTSNEQAIHMLDTEIKKQFLKETKVKKAYYDNLVISKREMDCIKLLLQGKTARAIGAELFISPRTVESHLENVKDKLLCRSKSELIAKLLKMQINN